MSLFVNNILERNLKINSLLCIGLDPEFNFIPDDLKKEQYPFFTFNKFIIDHTHEYALCYKPQLAHYSALSKEHELELTIRYIKDNYSDIPVILDSKRGDIGNTARHYATESFDRYGADATTVNPYMGYDSVVPFLERKDKGIFFLCKTSNPGANDFQDLNVNGKPLYERIAETIYSKWNDFGNCGLVVGGTNISDLVNICDKNFGFPILIPGIGSQGGDINNIKKSLSLKYESSKNIKFNDKLIFSVSRGVLYPDSIKAIYASGKSLKINDYFSFINESAKIFSNQTRDFTF